MLTGGLIGPVSLFMNDTPSIWLCTGEAGTLKTLDRCLRLHASDNPCSRDCGVIAMAGLLLHELTHICFRALFESPDTCAVSYLTQNYFLWAALGRYPRAGSSPCCATARTPGLRRLENSPTGDTFDVDDMSDNWSFPGLGSCDAAACLPHMDTGVGIDESADAGEVTLVTT